MKALKRIASWFYGAVIATRHRLYDWGVKKSYSFDIPVVCIGNITVGGTGKTPTAEFLLSSLNASYNIAILSRGYGRRTKGYREVQATDSYLDVGDEPLQMKQKFADTVVVVCEDRVAGIERIRKEHPEVNLIIMDDGFQHRRVKAKVNIVILDATRPYDNDELLPLGKLRDLRSRLKAAHFFIVSKCSENMTPLERRLWCKKLRFMAYQKIYFSTTTELPIVPLFEYEDRESVDYGQQAILLSSIGNSRPFVRAAEERFNVVSKLIFGDHHRYTIDNLKLINERHKQNPRAIILMTEKDAVKLRNTKRLPEHLRRKMYYQPIEMTLIDGPDRNFIGHLVAEIEHIEEDQQPKRK